MAYIGYVSKLSRFFPCEFLIVEDKMDRAIQMDSDNHFSTPQTRINGFAYLEYPVVPSDRVVILDGSLLLLA